MAAVGRFFYESLILNLAGTFFIDRKSGGSRCAEVTVIRGSTLISSIPSFHIISVVLLLDPKICLCIPESAADAVAVNPKGIKTLLANGLITFFISGNPGLSNGPRSLARNPPDYIILDN